MDMTMAKQAGRKAISLGASVVLAVSLVPPPAYAATGQGAEPGSDAVFEPAGEAPTYREAHEVECAPGEVLVEYDDASASGHGGLSLGLMESQLSSMAGLEVSETVSDRSEGHGTVVKAEVPEGVDPHEAAGRAEEVPGVASAQPNYIYRLMDGGAAGSGMTAGSLAMPSEGDPVAETNDTFLSQQYSLGSWEDTHGADVFAAWKSVKSDATAAENQVPVVTVAVLDTGVYVDHLDLKDQIWEDYLWDASHDRKPGRDGFLDASSNPTGDIVGHGTHVCGIAAATANNQQGIAGASYNAKLLPIKVFNDSSYQAYAKTEWLLKAYNYLLSDEDGDGQTVAQETNTHVVNMSLGGYGKEGEIDEQFEKAIEEAANADILTVCAGGNGDDYGNPITQPSWPSDFDACMAVTCLSAAGTNTYWSDFNVYKDISAPGVDILSSYNDKENSYTKMTGTSMASPLVAGIAALLFSADPSLTVDQAKDAIYSTANELDPKGQNYRKPIVSDGGGGVTGSPGCIDAAKAVESVLQNSGTKRVKIQECALGEVSDQLFTGQAVEPDFDVTFGSGDEAVKLQEGSDYRVKFENNVKVGTASATIIGMGGYVGRTVVHFNIRYDFTQATVMPDKESYVATGAALEPVVHVALGGRLLRNGVDYAVRYRDNAEVGTASIDVEGVGDYLGTVTETFEIAKAADKPVQVSAKRYLSKAGVAAVADQFYKKEQTPKPSPKLTDSKGSVLAPGVDYKLSYSGNNKPGYARVIAAAAGDTWTGQTDAYFRILSSVPKFKDVKKSTKYASDIKLAVRLGLMSGKGKKFKAKSAFTRGEAAAVLYSLAGSPKVSKKTKMTDVKSKSANYKALQWACENALLTTTGNKVKAKKAITQQDFANMLYRFGLIVGHGDMSVGANAFFSASDRAKVSDADRVGVAWAADKGVLALTKSKGKSLIKPTASVSRSVAAHMLVTACDAIYLPGQAKSASDDSIAAARVVDKVSAGVSDAVVLALESGLADEEELVVESDAVSDEATGESDGAKGAEGGSQGRAGALEAAQGDFVFTRVDGDLFVSGYRGGPGKVTIPSDVEKVKIGDELVSGPVKGIADGAFSGSNNLRTIEIPSSVETIGARAFYGCGSLVSASIPEGVASIGDEAFWGCSSLEEIDLPASLVQLGEQPFASQKLRRIGVSKSSVTFASVDGVLFSADKKTLVCYPMGRTYGSYSVPEGTTAIGAYAFRGVPNSRNMPLVSVTLPDGLEAIGPHAFRDADSVKGLKLPASVDSIGECAFADMNSLKELNLPATFVAIPDGFAQGCPMLVDFVLPASVKEIGASAFKGANIRSIAFPDGLTTIGAHAFENCKKLEGLTLPAALSSLGEYAFSGCIYITSVDLSATSLTTVARGAFSGAKGLAKVEVPSSIVELGEECFWGCSSLSKLDFEDTDEHPCALNAIPANAFANDPIESLTIPASIESIGAAAFSGNQSLESVVVQNQGEWSMAADAFAQTIPSEVFGYRDSSTWKHFAGCELRSIDVENDLPLAEAYYVADGGKARLRSMVVSESGYVSLQWRMDGVDVAGATGGVLTVAAADAGSYALVATNDMDPRHPAEFGTRVSVVPRLPIDIGLASVEAGSAAYTGKAVTVPVAASFDGAALVEGVDYEVSFSNNVKAGKGTVMLAGKGDFTGEKEVAFDIVAKASDFADAKSGWFAASVKEAAMRGLMSGKSSSSFSPTANATRGEVASALYRVANPGKSANEADALAWAVSKRVFSSAGSSTAAISRQDLAVALFDFAMAQGLKANGSSAAAFLELKDFNSVASSAFTACIFTCATGVLGAAGDGAAKKFQPKANATRADLARAVVALDDLV